MDDSGDRFPIGMRVLAVDDDPTCLLVLETLLRRCQYHVTTTSQARTALTMLRENKDKFDLVISDVHMPDMDGFKLLELVGLEMDLPVIMLSAYGDTKLVMKGISHGACDYLLKPVRLEELKNIWQHVIRKKKSDPKEKNKTSKLDKTTSESGSGLRSAGAENSDENGKLTKKRKDQDEDEDEDKENGNDNEDPSAQKKPRVVWSVELHRKFVAAVNQLGIEKAVPKKILDMMNVENITRENVASHLQKYRLYLKRISCVANQQASMVAALGSADQSYLRMGGSGHFHNNAFRSFSPNGIISNLNTPTGLNGHGFSPSGLLQLGQSQSFNNSSNDQLKFQPTITPVNQNILQGMPMSIGFDHLQNNSSKGVFPVQNLNTDVKPTFPIPNRFPDQIPKVTTSSSHPPSLGISNNGLMLETHTEGKHGGIGIGYGSSSSSVSSRHSDFSFSMLDQGRHSDNWSSVVPLSGIQTNSFPSSDCFRQTAIPPSDNMASLPLQAGYPGGSLADVHSQGSVFTNSPEYINGNLPFQGWEDRNQDATYHSNITYGSINSLAPVNGAVVPRGQTTSNSTLHRNLDTKFCDPRQMKHAGFADLTECSSSRQPRVNIVSQQKFSNNLGSLEYLASSMMEQEQDKMKLLGGDFICDSYSGGVSL
ncbi:two-component response regulator ARR12 [Trifolium pratense]|uniref:Uncharacterized protein n=1 Tax=Trifolium pratense TaxID=57577 RepID=A0ACB0JIZ4_TRIPR|nr:two-component response regulator ARR12 [Trifolium pratense]CAJ2643629.1 unnamed protein product [Trifolium pratense]